MMREYTARRSTHDIIYLLAKCRPNTEHKACEDGETEDHGGVEERVKVVWSTETEVLATLTLIREWSSSVL